MMPLIAAWHCITDTGAARIAMRDYLEHAAPGPRLEATLGTSCALKLLLKSCRKIRTKGMTRNGETESLPTQKYFFVPYNIGHELQG
jgi:hypothetical protein